MRFKVATGYLSVVVMYAPDEGRREDSKVFYEDLQHDLAKVNKVDYIVLAGDFNARVGDRCVEGVVGTYGDAVINENGKALRDFCIFNKIKITSTFFRKELINKYTWEARGLRSLIDYIILNEKRKVLVRDTHMYRGSK